MLQTRRRLHYSFRRLLIFAVLPQFLLAQPPSTVTLASSPNPSVYGAPVTLTATTGAGATGRMTFYDGASVLGISAVSNGKAALTTSLLPSGTRTLHAHYSGDTNNAAGDSNVSRQVVTTAPAGALQNPVNYGVGTTPYSVAVGDFNGDGKADLAVANQGSNNVTVMLGNGDGTFAPGVNYPVGSQPVAIAVGDFNGDGSADLAVANSFDGTVSILLGRGDGRFQPGRTFAAGSGPASIAAADFNGDGIADLVVANAASNNVSVFLGIGDGTFQAGANYAADMQPVSVVAADFNLDGHADLAVVNKTSNDVSVLLGKGDGTFQTAVNYLVGYPGLNYEPVAAAVGDFNGDGIPDLAVADSLQATWGDMVSVLLGVGDGTLGPEDRIGAGWGPSALAVGDFNGDGYLDIAVADYGSFNGRDAGVLLLFGTGDGVFHVPVQTEYPAGVFPIALAAGDFNGDGRANLAVANSGSGNVSVLLAGAPPVLTCSPGQFNFAVATAQDFLTQWCQVTSEPGGLWLTMTIPPATTQLNWLTETLDPDITPATLEAYTNGQSNILPGSVTAAVDLWDTASGTHLRVPISVSIGQSVCGYTLNSASVTVPPGGATGSFVVSNTEGCTATVASDSPWLTFTVDPLTSGFAPYTQTVHYSVAADAGGARSGHLTAGAQTFAVVQLGAQQVLQPVSVTPNSGSGSAATFAFVFADSAGAADLVGHIWFTLAPGTDYSATCKLYYVAATNQLHLVDDTGLTETVATLGATGALQNHQCSVNAGSSTAAWNGPNLTLTLPLTFMPVLAGALPVWMEAVGAAAGSAWAQEGRWTVTAPPDVVSAVSAKPCCGAGPSQAFTFTYADTSGAHSVQTAWVWFTPAFHGGSAAHTCQIYFDTTVGQWNLLDDTGTTWTRASFGVTLQNSQCSFSTNSGTWSFNGNNFTWSITLSFKPGFGGAQQVWMYAAESSTNNSGWWQAGTWTAASRIQMSVQPNAGSGVEQAFEVSVPDPDGPLTSVDMLINSTLSPAGACYVHINNTTGPPTLYLRSDDGTQWLGTGLAIGFSGSLQNGQCLVDAGNSHSNSAGSIFTIFVTFKAGFAGAKTIYLSAVDSFWSVGPQASGTWTVAPQPPNIPMPVSVSPVSSYGASEYFTFVFSDSWGVADLSTVNILFNNTLNYAHSCYISINPANESIQLDNDSDTGWLGPAYSSGAGLPLRNSQCTIITAGPAGFENGHTYAVAITVTFQPAFYGLMNIYSQANSIGGTTSGWRTLGSWTTYTATPSNVSLSPTSGAGHTGTFTFTFAYPLGASQISSVLMWFGNPPQGANQSSLNVPGTCILTYNQQTGLFYLLDDTGQGATAGAPGGAGGINNSQCKVDLSHSGVTVGANLVVQAAMTFSDDYPGSQGVWMEAFDSPDDVPGPLQQMGAWIVPASTVALSVAPNPAKFGLPVTLTASLQGGTGTMTFYDRSTLLGTSTMVSGTAVFSTILLSAGGHIFTAYYSGDGSHAADRSAQVPGTVDTVPWVALTPGELLKVGANPTSIAVADFNGDNAADLAVANRSSNNVSILLGKGDGTFSAAVAYPTGTRPQSVVAGDFNGDGVPDLAVGTSAGVSVLLGNGDGTFRAAVTYPAGAGGASSLAVADFNNDRILDLAAAGPAGTVILPGNGDGSLGAAVAVNASPAFSVAVGDFNGDGNMDLLVVPAMGNGVEALQGNGDFSFQSPVTYPTLGYAPAAAILCDISGHGPSDLAIGTQAAASNVLILLGGLGSFALQYSITSGNQPSALAAGDFNGDGKVDLAITSFQGSASTLAIMMGNGDGTFQPPTSYPVFTSQAALAVGDFSGDGRTDLALANYNDGTVTILFGAVPPWAVPVLSVSKSHSGNFTQGQRSAAYTVTVDGRATPVPTSGPVTVTENLPAGLTLASMAGAGWSCATPPGATCTRSDPLAPWKSYPPIAVQVSVASNAPAQAINQVIASGGGSAAAGAGDPTTIVPPSACDFYDDGNVSVTDVQTIVNEALGTVPAVHDLNHDGVVNVADVQKVIGAALGLGCLAP